MPTPENRALETLKAAGVVAAPVDVEVVAKQMGCKVMFQALKSDLSGLLVNQPGNCLIGVNSHQSKTRQRFTIAHELGHFLLQHKGEMFVDGTVLRRDENSSRATDPQEIEANRFAAALLMPAEWVYAKLTENRKQSPNGSVEEVTSALASQFDVSSQAMSIRLANLGCLIPD
ncbi:ImmA/IrrE family metallo-endopeptidase [Paraburkholderia megapolitana]|uniref:ImmA/IrrE family metallo-endopeptidase n=1 Tax=Paraburkholderia megapolitana TaxID=420953 RepID=UPI0038BC7EE9